ncbi:hypothetical protein Alches_17390 [Alicyclobacillus hesperidum subsp. aegles]|uniref:DUF4406 domain-containing protein n=1 Tax=Alicyclobacillus hesperidum TaxID=89784 RepID=UPI00222D8E96|nr:DUF4406 domain-containing protein [Alicyclobacillus hesperidum]GLG01699.1 hypothetical protein Alches_17390 [Alicyclobacillus hesperidum subsp. aegles]
MKVYISGPMSGLPEYNFPAFFRAADAIRQQGDEPINPAEGAPEGWTWEQYMRRALRMLLDADAVVMLPGWQQSQGARLEYVIAQQLGMPTTFLEDGR